MPFKADTGGSDEESVVHGPSWGERVWLLSLSCKRVGLPGEPELWVDRVRWGIQDDREKNLWLWASGGFAGDTQSSHLETRGSRLLEGPTVFACCWTSLSSGGKGPKLGTRYHRWWSQLAVFISVRGEV